MKARSRPATAAVIAITVLVLDQLSKAWALRALADGPINVVGDWAEFHLAWNSGSAFSMLSGSTWLLTGLGVVLLGVLAVAVLRATDNINRVALALLLGGALGNLTDRFFRAPGIGEGHVVDFISVGSWPVFNIADSAITVGVIVLMWRTWQLDGAAKRADQGDHAQVSTGPAERMPTGDVSVPDSVAP